jgi:hypothetical protein
MDRWQRAGDPDSGPLRLPIIPVGNDCVPEGSFAKRLRRRPQTPAPWSLQAGQQETPPINPYRPAAIRSLLEPADGFRDDRLPEAHLLRGSGEGPRNDHPDERLHVGKTIHLKHSSPRQS